MTSPTDRTAEAPRVLGVAMTKHRTRWRIKFGVLLYEIETQQPYLDAEAITWLAGAPYCGTVEACRAAIERELLAIRDAIPARAAEPPQPASVGGVPSVAANNPTTLGDVWVGETKPAEPPQPSNEELMATAKAALDRLGTATMFIVDPEPLRSGAEDAYIALSDSLSELERRLVKP